MQTSTNQNAGPSKNQIEQIARTLWQKAGQPQNRDLEFWLKAEDQLKSGQNGQSTQNGQSAQSQNTKFETSSKREEQPKAPSLDAARTITPDKQSQSRRDRK